jgi:hemerythrin-like domain-containing protein
MRRIMASELVLDALEADHRNLRRLLELAEAEVEMIAGGETADLDLLADIMDYAAGYPTLVHRPREELLFELLRQRGTSAASVQEVLRQHAALVQSAKRANATVDKLGQEVSLPRDEIVRDLRHLIAAYRGHMAIEERLFAEARGRLDDADWARIAGIGGKDPLFDARPEARYRRLATRLASAGV